MNKSDLIRELGKVVGTKKEAEAAVDTILEAITKALKMGDRVTLVDFGTFSVSNRAAREGRNPQTVRRSKSPPERSPSLPQVRA